MNSVAKAALCVATLIQVPAIFYFLSVDRFPAVLATLFIALSFGVWFFYFWDIPRNERVPKERERAWWWAVLLAPYVAEPLYFFKFIWKDEQV
jgi:hypothetical protein